MVAFPRDPGADTPGLRTLGTAATQAASGADGRFPGTGQLTVKASYIGSPGVAVFYSSYDVSGNAIQARTGAGVVESSTIPGLYFFDQVVSLDQFVAVWDENDGLDPAIELIATRHPVRAPLPPVSVTAVAGDTQATITFTPGDSGGAAVTAYTVTAIDSTNGAHGGQTQSGLSSGIIVSGLTNGESYTFTVTATTSFGTSASSAASNSIVPAVVVSAPGAPTGLTATTSSTAGQATVSFTAPANTGGAAITNYVVTAVDETTPANGGQTHSGTALSQTVTSLVNGDVYHFTAKAVNSAGTSVTSLASNSVTIPSGAGAPIATFTYSQPSSSTILLDGTGSSGGTATWSFDGTAATGTALTLTIGPVKVGTHTVQLSMNGGTAGVSATSRSIDVAWVGRPLGDGQHDAYDGNTGTWINTSGGTVSTTLLPQWASLPSVGPWRNKNVLNMVEGYPGAGDGTARIVVFDSNHVSLMTRYGDRPGVAGGYRSALEMTTSYDATLAGHQFGTTGDINICGNLPLDGSGNPTSPTGQLRFYRLDIMFPSTNPGGTAAPIGFRAGQPWQYQNNAFELHGNAGGSSPVRFQTNGAGTQWQWAFESIINGSSSSQGGQQNFDTRNTLYDTWYKYIVEFLLSTVSTVGYVRFWRDVGAGYAPIITSVPAGTILTGADAGKYFAVTQQTSKAGAVIPMAVDCQNYRTRSTMPAGYPDATIHYSNVVMGPTMASVLI